MKRALVFLFSILFLSILPARAQEFSLQLRDAIRPLEENLPDISILRLRELLKNPLPEKERRSALQKLAEALIASNQTDEALRVLEDPLLRDQPAAKFLRAQACAAAERWLEALHFYEEVASDGSSPTRSAAIFGAAEALRALKRPDEALQKFALLDRDKNWSARARLRMAELLLDRHDVATAERVLAATTPPSPADKKERHFLRGRLDAERGQPEKAIEVFQSILKNPQNARHEVLIAAVCGIGDAHLQLKIPETGDDFLEAFIEQHPQDAGLPTVFAKLDELYRAERKPARNELARWSRDAAQPRRALAQWYLARAFLRAGRRDDALSNFAELRKSGANFPELAEAFLENAQLQIDDGHFDQAIETLNAALPNAPAAARDKIEMLMATAQYRAKRYEGAAQIFDRLAHSSKSEMGKDALVNASLTWLELGKHERFLIDYEQLEKSGADAKSAEELSLEEGLVQAAHGDKNASATLQNFLRKFPQSSRAADAWVALAELAFHAAPPRLDEARNNLSRAFSAQPNAAARERADYLEIWIEDAAAKGEQSRVIALANEFLQKHRDSALSSEVRMKLAEAYFRRQDFANAQTQFELLAEKNPNAPFAEQALFFAGQSAMSSMGARSLDQAIVAFDEVVRKNGELKWAARNEQAAIERKLGKPQQALLLYEEILKGDAKPAEKREALCGRGDIYLELAAVDPKNFERAIESYEALAADKGAGPHWRNQALFKKGVCFEKKSDRASALSIFYKIIEDELAGNGPREFFWFYKAGFDAARILEEEAKWKPAAAIYEKLVSAGGTRSEEARTRLKRLQLEHFLWEE